MKKVLAMLIMLIALFSICNAVAETVVGDPSLTLHRQTLEYKGRSYQLKPRLSTIVFLGIDQRQKLEVSEGKYRQGGQADFILLLVIDDNAETVSAVFINRDTMADIRVMNVLGQETGTQHAQLCLAYSYGDGGDSSCRLMITAIQQYLMDTPIDHYFAMNLDGIGALNDLLGGVEVTLEDDFSEYDSEMIVGTTIRLSGSQAEIYLRNRYYVGDSSNSSRMERQKAYLQSIKDILIEKDASEISDRIMNLFDALAPYSVTDMNRGYMINLSSRSSRYELISVREIGGSMEIGENGFMEFHADEDSLMETILSSFYDSL